MSDAASAFVSEATEKASWLVGQEVRGPGDVENAMRRLEMKFGIPYAALWALRYRPPKSVVTELFVRICEAHEIERASQRKRFNDEDAITHPKTWFGETIARAARTLVREKDGTLKCSD